MTAKHTLLGCGIHSTTGLRKPVDILVRLGHSCSYDKVREIESAQADLAQYFTKNNFLLSDVPKNESCVAPVHLWWDNYDSEKDFNTGI